MQVSFPRTMVILFCMVHIPNVRIDEILEMTSFTERGTCEENTSIGVVQPPLRFV